MGSCYTELALVIPQQAASAVLESCAPGSRLAPLNPVCSSPSGEIGTSQGELAAVPLLCFGEGWHRNLRLTALVLLFVCFQK